MAKEFVVRVAQISGDENFDWVVRGMGRYVSVIRVVEVKPEEIEGPMPGGEWEYLVYHTGPEEALYSIPGEGFVYPNSSLPNDENPPARPWEP